MQWEKTANREWTAKGKIGTWYITQCGRTFWGRYVSNNGLKSFKMRPARKLSEAKAACESNYYWEEKPHQTEVLATKTNITSQKSCGPVQQTIPI